MRGIIRDMTPTGSNAGLARVLDTASIITSLTSPREAIMLPPGAVVGDTHGGLTFTDAVSAVLEARSLGGWQEVEPQPGQLWTIIVLSH
jgi:hypothetical protein